MAKATVTVRLLFADEGFFHEEEVSIPASALERHDRLIDVFQDDEEVQKSLFVDLDRLCSAQLLD